MKRLTITISVLFGFLTLFPILKKWSPSFIPWRQLPLAIALCVIAYLVWPVQASATISESVYLCNQDHGSAAFTDFEWCADTGTNRFVTNDRTDFVPSSIVTISTKVLVGNGSYTCTTQGTVLIRNPAGKIIECHNTLYMPHCSTKLLPATPFVRKGCIFTLFELQSAEGKLIMSGKEINGLYYYTLSARLSTHLLCRLTRRVPNQQPPHILDSRLGRISKRLQVIFHRGYWRRITHTATSISTSFARFLI